MHQNTANNSLSQSNFSKLQFWNVYFKWHEGQNKTRFLFVHLRGEREKNKKKQRRESFALKVKFNVSPARQEKKAETVSGAGKSGNIF